MWNLIFAPGPPDETRHKLDVLNRHCDDVGRNPADIRKTLAILVDPLADVDGFVSTAAQYAALGFDLVNVIPPPHITDPVGFVSRLGDEVIPKLAEISDNQAGSARKSWTRP